MKRFIQNVFKSHAVKSLSSKILIVFRHTTSWIEITIFIQYIEISENKILATDHHIYLDCEPKINSNITVRCDVTFRYGPDLQALSILCVYNICNTCQDHFYGQYHKTFSQNLLVSRKNVCVNKIDVNVKTQWLLDILLEMYCRLRYINCSCRNRICLWN